MVKIFLVSSFLIFNLAVAEGIMNFSIAPDSVENKYTDKYFHNGKRNIYATGEIDFYAGERLKRFVRSNNISSALVVFNSNGGSLIGGIKLGETIRNMNFSTTIGYMDKKGYRKFKGVCASACAYAFAGGQSRYIDYDQQSLGLHQFYNETKNNLEDAGSTQVTAARVSKHLSDMGIANEAFILASATNSKKMTWLSKTDALKLNFANNGKGQTYAEISINNDSANGKRRVFLNVEQTKEEGVGRLLFYCQDNTLKMLGGIVTNKKSSMIHWGTLKRNYFELDDGSLLPEKGRENAFAKDDVLWIHRKLSSEDIDRLLNSNKIGIWTEDNSVMRWGIEIDIYPVQRKMREFMSGCRTPNSNLDVDATLSSF